MAERFNLYNDINNAKGTFGDHFQGSVKQQWRSARDGKPDTQIGLKNAINEMSVAVLPQDAVAKQKRYMRRQPKPRDMSVKEWTE